MLKNNYLCDAGGGLACASGSRNGPDSWPVSLMKWRRVRADRSQNRSIVKVLQAQPDSDRDFLVSAVLKDDLDVAAVRHARGCRDALRIDACSYEGLPDRVGALLRQGAIRS